MRWDSDEPPFLPTALPRGPALVRSGLAVVVVSVAACGSDDGSANQTGNNSMGTGSVAPMLGTGGLIAPMEPPMPLGTGGVIAPMVPPMPGTGGFIAPMWPPMPTGGGYPPMPPPMPATGGAIEPMPPPGGSGGAGGLDAGAYDGGAGEGTGTGGTFISPMPPPMPAPIPCGPNQCSYFSTCCDEVTGTCSLPGESCAIAPMPPPMPAP